MTTLSILVTTCREMGASVSDVRGPGRHRKLVAVREEVARRARLESHSFPSIARVLGRKHHSSAIWWSRGGRPEFKRARLVKARWLVARGAGL